jgi:Family of unknown function (DUF6317)
MSGRGFQVVMSDLLDASSVFHAEAATLKAIMPDDGPSCPDGGDAAFDKSLQVVAGMIGTLHLQAAGVMDSDAAKLKKAHDNYVHTEESLIKLISQISSPDEIN